jgi:glycosyltransferase involved in cell wall biosynthesis
MAHVSSPTRLILAGRGTHEGELRRSIDALGVADRVELAGFVPDAALIDLYADALAVVYAPFDEDYGYVTLQAFRSGKPVITTHDAGGILEWVEDGVTGFVTDPTPEAVGAAVERIANDPALAQRMGDKARARVADLSWEPVVARLLGR